MNGRIYDPLLGRMLSADIMVQNPLSLQSFNRYSYVQNNPLSLIDPSGFQAVETATTATELASEEEVAKAMADVFKSSPPPVKVAIILLSPLLISGDTYHGPKSPTPIRPLPVIDPKTGQPIDPQTGRPTAPKPLEVKIDKNAIQSNGQGDTVKPNQPPTQEAKSDAPKKDEKASSKELRKNLDKDGRPVGKDEAAHHIVAGTDKRAAESRALLAEAGIGINDAANGVGLPQNTASPNPDDKTVHSTVHTDEYHDSVTETLRNTAPEDREAALRAIREQLEKKKN